MSCHFEKSRRAYEEAFTERQRADVEYAARQKLPDAPHGLRFPIQGPPATVDPSFAGDSYSECFASICSLAGWWSWTKMMNWCRM